MTTHRAPNEAERGSANYQRSVLESKLGIWRSRMQYAKGARRSECLSAVADLEAKIAAL